MLLKKRHRSITRKHLRSFSPDGDAAHLGHAIRRVTCKGSNAVSAGSLTHVGPELLDTSHLNRKDGFIGAEHMLLMALVGDRYDTYSARVMFVSELSLREVIDNHTIADADSVLQDVAFDVLNIGCGLCSDTLIGGVQLEFCGLQRLLQRFEMSNLILSPLARGSIDVLQMLSVHPHHISRHSSRTSFPRRTRQTFSAPLLMVSFKLFFKSGVVRHLERSATKIASGISFEYVFVASRR